MRKAISYDALNRLVQVAQGVDVAGPGVLIPVEDYAYDGEGNRLASHLAAFHASNAHNQLTEDARYTYAYDARGNRVSRTAKATGAVETYSYDSQNRLVGYASPTTTATYAYDALDRRIAPPRAGAPFILAQIPPGGGPRQRPRAAAPPATASLGAEPHAPDP